MSVGMLEISGELDDKDDNILEAGLDAHTDENKRPPYQEEPLSIISRDEDDQPIAGLKGTSVWDWLFIDLLWVADDYRGQGYGTALLKAAEEEAERRGCHAVYLWTHNWQGKDFYPKLGYKEFAALPDFPIGSTRIGFMKSLKTVIVEMKEK